MTPSYQQTPPPYPPPQYQQQPYQPRPGGINLNPLTFSKGKKIALLGSILLIIGGILPWATYTSWFGYEYSYGGSSYVIGLSIFAIILLFIDELITKNIKEIKLCYIALGILGLGGLALLNTIWAFVNIAFWSSIFWGALRASPGIGLYLSLIASLILMLGGFVRYRETR